MMRSYEISICIVIEVSERVGGFGTYGTAFERYCFDRDILILQD